MGLRVAFELDDKDLKHFRLIMREVRRNAARMAPEDIVESAEAQLAAVSEGSAPGFILDRIHKLRLMISMLTDIEWRLPHDEATRVLNALAYFTEPEDLIPDHIPGVGFLDDAIMVELVVRELKHEIDAYEDFCSYRDSASRHGGRVTRISREDWLDKRRKELQARMRRRRQESTGKDSGKSAVGLFD
jgi:uncharacterized membrane protein YkvA (DUF1232 family)